MPEFIVKTQDNRNLVIEADQFGKSIDGTYIFTKDDRVVASVPNSNVFAVAENDAWKADFYTVDDWDADESDDVCSDCRFSELLESDQFFEAVYGVVDAVLSTPDDPEDSAPETPQPDPPVPVIEHRTNGDSYLYGFQGEKGFVNFGSDRSNAEGGLRKYKEGLRNWAYMPLHGYTKVED